MAQMATPSSAIVFALYRYVSCGLLQSVESGIWTYKGKDDKSVIGVELALSNDGRPSTEGQDSQAKHSEDDDPCQQGVAASTRRHV
mgnify:CR=1 FL=1